MEEYSGQRKARPRRWGKVKHSGSLDTRARPRNSVEWGIQRNDQIKEKTFCHKYHFEVVLYKLPRSPQQNCLLLTSSTWAGREAMDGCVLGKYKLHHYQGKKKTLDIQLYGEWNFGTKVLPVKLLVNISTGCSNFPSSGCNDDTRSSCQTLWISHIRTYADQLAIEKYTMNISQWKWRKSPISRDDEIVGRGGCMKSHTT